MKVGQSWFRRYGRNTTRKTRRSSKRIGKVGRGISLKRILSQKKPMDILGTLLGKKIQLAAKPTRKVVKVSTPSKKRTTQKKMVSSNPSVEIQTYDNVEPSIIKTLDKIELQSKIPGFETEFESLTSFDIYELEDINCKEKLKEDKNTILLTDGKNNTILDKDTILEFIKDNQNLLYICDKAIPSGTYQKDELYTDEAKKDRPPNAIYDLDDTSRSNLGFNPSTPYILIGNLGVMTGGIIKVADIKQIIESGTRCVFLTRDTSIKHTMVSYSFITSKKRKIDGHAVQNCEKEGESPISIENIDISDLLTAE